MGPLLLRRENEIEYLHFFGPLSHEAIVNLSLYLRAKLHGSKNQKAIFGTFVELAQNINCYSAERLQLTQEGKLVGVGVIRLLERDGLFLIEAGNLLESEKASLLEQRISEICSLSREHLRETYRRKRASPPESGTRSGLGLLEMAKLVDFPLGFERQPHSEHLDFIRISARFQKGAP